MGQLWPKMKQSGVYSHKDKGEDTQGICVTFKQRKEAKRCGSPHKIRAMYEIKGNKEVYS